jgi:ATP-binding cassette subfamily B protein RaxB
MWFKNARERAGMAFEAVREWWNPRLPTILQSEATECGLACVGMVANYFGYLIDIVSLRRQHSISLKGATLSDLIRIAKCLGLNTRPLRLELEDLPHLQTPCILHWNLDHFVVLKEVHSDHIVIHDPAQGRRVLTLEVASRSFTGVALELWKDAAFQATDDLKSVKLGSIVVLDRIMKRSLAVVLGLALLLEFISLVNPLFMKAVVDSVVVTSNAQLLLHLAIGFAMITVLQQTLSYGRMWSILRVSSLMGTQWRLNAFSHLIRLPIQFFEKRFLGDITSRFGAIDQIQRTLSSAFIEGLLDGLMAILTGVMMFWFSKVLGMVVLGTMLLYTAARIIWYPKLKLATDEQIVDAAKQQTHFIETIRGIRAIKLFRRAHERQNAWGTLLTNQVNSEVRTQLQLMRFRTVNGTLFGLENVLIIWLGATLVLDKSFSVGTLLAFISYKSEFAFRMSSFIDKVFEMKMLKLQTERLSEILLTAAEEDRPAQIGVEKRPEDTSVTFENVSFRYSDNEPDVLKDINLTILPGQSVAIIGPSGGGKSTLINLLLGILKPTSGRVLLGGLDIHEIGVDYVRDVVATVLQDDTLFAGSVEDNISFFDPAPDQEWIEQCARLAAIDNEILVMPMGYKTLIAEMGAALSGGQKQRVLIARALYKRPSLLVLDEATSHLDILREAQVNSAIRALAITRVFIAHRTETIATADRVVGIVDGAIISDMTMDEQQFAEALA